MLVIVGAAGLKATSQPVRKLIIAASCLWSLGSAAREYLLVGILGSTLIAVGSLGWTFVGEVASQKLRARTGGLAAGEAFPVGLTDEKVLESSLVSPSTLQYPSCVSHLRIFRIYSTDILVDANGRNLGYNTAWIFVGLGGLANILAFFFVPEPARRSPAELDELYEKHIPAWRMRGYVTDVEKEYQTRREARTQGDIHA